ncbi:MAG: hypothetical protein CHACPFDD_02807 [Phycisphaerae bacterium]|nr:hypothetical protein [Phycisphaerae bacterium]
MPTVDGEAASVPALDGEAATAPPVNREAAAAESASSVVDAGRSDRTVGTGGTGGHGHSEHGVWARAGPVCSPFPRSFNPRLDFGLVSHEYVPATRRCGLRQWGFATSSAAPKNYQPVCHMGVAQAISRCVISGVAQAISRCVISGVAQAISRCVISGVAQAISRCVISGVAQAISLCALDFAPNQHDAARLSHVPPPSR